MNQFFDKEAFSKPPIGVVPCKILQSSRINELASAICRYSETFKCDTKKIKKWAIEIEKLCDVIQALEDGDTHD